MSGYDAVAQRVDNASSVRRVTREMDGNRETFSGKYVKHVIITAGLPGGGNVQETSVWNQPHALPTAEVHINLVRTLVPFSVTVDVERDSMDASMASAVEQLIDQARSARARRAPPRAPGVSRPRDQARSASPRLENLQMLGDGTGLQATVTDAAT